MKTEPELLNERLDRLALVLDEIMPNCANLVRDAMELLKEQKAKHGEWITIWREDDPYTSSHGRCSVCNRISERPLGEYCKWCGSKMDLEGNE